MNLLVFTSLLLVPNVFAGPKIVTSSEVKHLYMSSDDTAELCIHPFGSILSFPLAPGKIVSGRAGQFEINPVANDLTVISRSPKAKTHLFSYLHGRRFSFILKACKNPPVLIYVIHDKQGGK